MTEGTHQPPPLTIDEIKAEFSKWEQWKAEHPGLRPDMRVRMLGMLEAAWEATEPVRGYEGTVTEMAVDAVRRAIFGRTEEEQG